MFLVAVENGPSICKWIDRGGMCRNTLALQFNYVISFLIERLLNDGSLDEAQRKSHSNILPGKTKKRRVRIVVSKSDIISPL